MTRHCITRACLAGICAALLAACAAAPDAPPPPAAAAVPPPPVTAPPAPVEPPPQPAIPAETPPAIPLAPPGPALAMTPEQRARAELFAEESINKVLLPMRGDRDRLRRALGVPATITSRSMRSFMESMIDLFADPAAVHRLVTNMTNMQLAQIQAHPGLALEVVGSSFDNNFISSFNSLDLAQQKALIRIFGDVYGAATPAECQAMSQHNPQSPQIRETMFALLDRLPDEESRSFGRLMMQSAQQPHQPLPPPLTAADADLVRFNLQHYMNSQPDEVRARLQQAGRTLNGPDRCWMLSKVVDAMFSGDEDITNLGVRFFLQGMIVGAGKH